MIFTLRSNQARVERAERAAESKLVAAVIDKAAAEAAKAAVEAEERTRAAVAAAIEAVTADAREKLAAELAARQRAWEGWNERRLAAERDGRPFTEPPPGTISGMNGNGSA